MPLARVRAEDLCVGDRVGVRGQGSSGYQNQNDLRYFEVAAVQSETRHVPKTRAKPYTLKKYEWVEDNHHRDGGQYEMHKEFDYEMIDESYVVDEVLYRLVCDRPHTWRRVAAMMPVTAELIRRS